MTLREQVQDAKAQMVRGIEDTFTEIEREAKSIDGLKTACQRSHRCWPSLIMVGVLIGLLVVNWCLASWQAEEQAKKIQSIREELWVSLDERVKQVDAETQQSMNAWKERIVIPAPVTTTPLVQRRWWRKQ